MRKTKETVEQKSGKPVKAEWQIISDSPYKHGPSSLSALRRTFIPDFKLFLPSFT